MNSSLALRRLLAPSIALVVLHTHALAALAGGAGPTSDDFNQVNLDLGTWSLVNPLGDGQLAMIGAGSGDAHVALSLPVGTAHDIWGVGAPRIMQPAMDSDFEVEVKFNFEPAGGFNDQGLVVEQDASNWLRLDVYHNGSVLKAFIGKTVGGSNTSILNATISAGTASYLRVRRTGDTFDLELSGDGSSWSLAGSVTQALAVTQVGVYAGNPVDALAFTSEVDYFSNTAAPVVNEDVGVPADPDSPLIHSVVGTPGTNALTVTWFTDEPCQGSVEYGLTTSYELGTVSDGGGLYAHDVDVSGLQTGVTYHYRVSSDDGTNPASVTGDFELLLDPTGPLVDVWYGLDQTFGSIGLPQPWANVLGRVSDADGVSALSYTLNGGSPVALTIGPDGRRLENAGDFNVDLALADLLPGANVVEITAVDGLSNPSVRSVTVTYLPANLWPLPYSIDWDAGGAIDDYSQVVDGLFTLEAGGLRTTEPGYDRLAGFGQTSWDDCEVLVPITMNSLSPTSGGVGLLMRWNGHTDYPIAGTQPKSGYLPLGCIGWYRNGRVELFGNDGTILDTDPRTLTEGVTYWFRMRVETVPGVGGLYKLKVWEDGQTEPVAWDVQGQETLSDPQFGSVLLISHQYDATFGDVTVTDVPGAPNTPPVAVDDTIYAPPAGAVDADLLANDLDDGILLPQTLTITQQPTSGNVYVQPTTGIVTYTHDGSPSTADEFRYTVLDNDGAVSNEAVVSVVVTNDPPAPFPSDDFNCGLDPEWTFVDPLRDGSFALVGAGSGDAWLELSLPAGTAHDAWGAGGLNESVRFMRPAQNLDFEMLVEWKDEPTGGYDDQGIIVESDASNWLRFDVFHDGTNLRAFAGRTIAGTNSTITNSIIAPGTATHARVVRAGNGYTFELSGDGSSWALVASFSQALIVQEVGVYAANPIDALAFTSRVDYVFEASQPIVPEDGSACLDATLALSVADCQDDADPSSGQQVVVELDVLDISVGITEYAAYVDYDLGALSYRGDLSAYSGSVFTTHVAPILQADDGLLELDGSQVASTSADALLATLVFDVLSPCDATGSVLFEVGGTPSECGLLGSPIGTTLVDPDPFVLDDTPPVIAPNPDLTYPADAGVGGGCDSAVVTYTPTATDACSAVTIECTPPSGTAFPAGATTTVTCVATDACGNTDVDTFDVTVTLTNTVSLDVQLVGVTTATTRCIQFVTNECGTVVDVPLAFDATGLFSGEIEVPCGTWTTLCAKDEQHTLWDTSVLGFNGGGTKYVASTTLDLEGGDTDNDGDVDINDVTLLLLQFGGLATLGPCPWDGTTRDSDFSNNGAVAAEDYSFLAASWLSLSSCACTIASTGGGRPHDRLSQTAATTAENRRADVNRDGQIDWRDVAVVESRLGLSGELSSRMRMTER